MASLTSAINVQVDTRDKEEATNLLKDLGLNMSTYFNMAIKQLIKKGGVPFEINNPKPSTEGGYGKPLGSHSSSDLTGFLKIKIKNTGHRIVYQYVKDKDGMRIIIISIRDEEKVYKEAERRIEKLGGVKWARKENEAFL